MTAIRVSKRCTCTICFSVDNKPVLSRALIFAMLVILSMRLGAHSGLVKYLLPLGMLGVYWFRAANQMLWLPETLPKSTK